MAVPAGEMTRQRPCGSGVPAGTVAVIVFPLRVNAAGTWYSVTEVAPLKFAPLSVTVEPTGPLMGLSDPIAGSAVDREPVVGVKIGSWSAVPAVVVTRQRPGPGVPAGTVATRSPGESTTNEAST